MANRSGKTRGYVMQQGEPLDLEFVREIGQLDIKPEEFHKLQLANTPAAWIEGVLAEYGMKVQVKPAAAASPIRKKNKVTSSSISSGSGIWLDDDNILCQEFDDVYNGVKRNLAGCKDNGDELHGYWKFKMENGSAVSIGIAELRDHLMSTYDISIDQVVKAEFLARLNVFNPTIDPNDVKFLSDPDWSGRKKSLANNVKTFFGKKLYDHLKYVRKNSSHLEQKFASAFQAYQTKVATSPISIVLPSTLSPPQAQALDDEEMKLTPVKFNGSIASATIQNMGKGAAANLMIFKSITYQEWGDLVSLPFNKTYLTWKDIYLADGQLKAALGRAVNLPKCSMVRQNPVLGTLLIKRIQKVESFIKHVTEVPPDSRIDGQAVQMVCISLSSNF